MTRHATDRILMSMAGLLIVAIPGNDWLRNFPDVRSTHLEQERSPVFRHPHP